MNQHDSRRAEYIAIATRKFAAQGYHGASLAALASDAGVTKQALLHFFGTKESLYGEVLEGLSQRLIDSIDAAQRPDPTDHLNAYFLAMRSAAENDPMDIRLLVRASLDSVETARKWPLKPFLDRLTQIALATPSGQGASSERALAWVCQMIGMIEYLAISAPAMSGMYGKGAATRIAEEFEPIVIQAVNAFAKGA